MHQQGYLVDGGGIDTLGDGLGSDIAELGHFAEHRCGDFLFGAEHEDVGLQTHLLQLLYAMLRGFGLEFFCGTYVGDVGEMDQQGIATELPAQLSHCLKEGG